MTTTFAPGHPSTKCVECDADLTEDTAKPVEVKVDDTDPIRVGGIYRCIDCDMFVAVLGKDSKVDLNGVHKHLVEHVIPNIMARMQLYSIALSKLERQGRDDTPEAMQLAFEALMFTEVGAAEMAIAADLCEALDEKFGVNSVARIEARMWEIVRESTPKMTEQQVTDLIDKLDLQRDKDGEVTYLCPNPNCPEEGDRHPLSFAEKIMPDELVAGILARMPD